jgi:hypothetical protein
LIFSLSPFIKLNNFITLNTHFNVLQKCLKYILALLLIRLFRFILRFIAVFILMIVAIISWFCRKRVRKGRKEEILDVAPLHPASDGILMIGLNQKSRYRR